MSKSQAERRLERGAEELEHRIERLKSHIDKARGKAAKPDGEVEVPRAAAGDRESTEPGHDPARPDDPAGAGS